MKARKAVVVIIISLFILSACGRESLPNAYVEGSDFQYMQMNDIGEYMDIQKGEGCYYLRHGDFIYYLDETTNKILPLCNKVDCLHDKETQQIRKEKCNAYVADNNEFCKGISYCNGFIYCLEATLWFDEGNTQKLYRISADGAKKELAYQFSDDRWIQRWGIHRDIFYYVEKKYMEKEKDGQSELIDAVSLKAIDLKDIVKRPMTIFSITSDEAEGPVIAHIQCYGNYIYYLLDAATTLESDGEMHRFTKTYIYDLNKRENKELTISKRQEGVQVIGCCLWNGRLLIKAVSGYEQDYFKPAVMYAADLDGSNIEVCMENIQMGHTFSCDEEYLYKTDIAMVELSQLGFFEYDKDDETYWVYDKELKLVDTYMLPSDITLPVGAPRPGTSECMYLIYDDSENPENWGVLKWDKSGIGSYNGKQIEMETIPYEG